MHAASRHGTPSLTSLPKDGGVSCFWSFIWKVAHPVSDRTQPCLTSVKLMELAGPLGHSPKSCFYYNVELLGLILSPTVAAGKTSE